MCNQPSWGIATTVKAPARDILNFAAYHLELGADRITLYLDAPNDAAAKALSTHPNCRTVLTDDAYWQEIGYRPVKHQVRQQLNATHCLTYGPGVDWLAHIDIDEFLWPVGSALPAQLSTLSDSTLSARISPIEALAPDPADPPPEGAIWFKSCNRDPKQRRAETAAIYPGYGSYLKGGFFSHVQGKVFVRTGQDATGLRLHHATRISADGTVANDKPVPLPGTRLCHLHAPTFETWRQHFRFRLKTGAYRQSLKPAPGSKVSLHNLLCQLETEGEEALSAFYQHISCATPDLRARLSAHGHLHLIRLDLDAKRARHFPDFA